MLAFCVILIPDDASIYIANLRMSVARLMLLISAPFVAAHFVSTANRRCAPGFLLTDGLVLLTGIWMVFAASMTDGLAQALPSSGADALELVVPYFICRAFLTSEDRCVQLAQKLSILIAVAGMLALLDTFGRHYVVHDAIAKLMKATRVYRYDGRFGTIRAAGTFPHPILLGIACCFGVTLSSVLRGGKRAFALTGGIVGLIASISSAPLMGLMMVAGCFAYRKLTDEFDGRWRALIAIVSAMIAAFAFASNHPMGYLISHLALDPATGFYRLLIWQYAGSAVMDSPLFGIGLTLDWVRPEWMPETVDSLWLRAAMTYGIPGSIMIALCLLAACSRRTDIKRANLSVAGHQLGLALSLIVSLCLYLGFTVYFWSSVWILMSLVIGMRTSIGVIAGRPRELPRAVRYTDPVQLGLTGIRQSVHEAP